MPSIGTVVCGLRILFVLVLGFGSLSLAGTVQAKGTGLIFVSNEKGNTITVLDGKTNAVLRTIETCRRPRGMHFSKDRNLFFVGCADDNRIAVYEVASLKLVDRIRHG